MSGKIKEILDGIVLVDSAEANAKRDNANINGDTAMGAMLQIGANTAKEYYLDNMVPAEAEGEEGSMTMHREMTLAEVAREIHENAKAHGWWDEEREAAEIYALIHSEWSEALEEYRAGRPDRWFSCVAEDTSGVCPERNCNPDLPCVYRGKKPEGICVELIDGVIRIFDYLGMTGGAEEYTDGTADCCLEMQDEKGEEMFKEWQELSVPSLINMLHNEVCKIDILCAKEFGLETECFMGIASIAWRWIKGRGLDPMELLIEKHEYNKTRPYKHGKVC